MKSQIQIDSVKETDVVLLYQLGAYFIERGPEEVSGQGGFFRRIYLCRNVVGHAKAGTEMVRVKQRCEYQFMSGFGNISVDQGWITQTICSVGLNDLPTLDSNPPRQLPSNI